MAFKVFISHSIEDVGLVYELDRLLRLSGMEPYVAEWYVEPGKPLWQKVKEAITGCHCVLVILSKYGLRSPWVNQELAVAEASGRLIIPLVERGVEPRGLLEGKEYIPFDSANAGDAMKAAVRYLESCKIEKERRDAIGAIILVFLGLLALDEWEKKQKSAM